MSVLTGRRFVGKMRGGTQAHLIEASNGHFYVVKFVNNPQHRRILINEWLGAAILRHLGISTPPTEIIHIDRHFLSNNSGVYLQTRQGRCLPSVGPHFASQCPGDLRQVVVYDFLPDPLLACVENRSHFEGALAFDKWTCNTDSRQALFFRTPVVRALTVQMVDQGSIFGGAEWRLFDSPIQGGYFRPCVYGARDRSAFEPWVTRIQQLPISVITGAIRGIPASWLEGDETALDRLIDMLFRRRERLLTLVEDYCASLDKAPQT